MKVWITRDKNNRPNEICLWAKKPRRYKDGDRVEFGFMNDEERERGDYHLLEMGIIDFENFFGYEPKKGSCVKKELILK